MITIHTALIDFLGAQQKRLKKRTYSDYENVIDLFQIYLNSYGQAHLDKNEMEKWEKEYEVDEESFTKIFGLDKLDFAIYSDFLGYFIIRKVASGASFMQTSVRVLKKLTNWLLENNYIEQEQHNDLMDYFSDGKSKALPNAEKVSDLLYNQAKCEPDRSYEQILEDYFVIERIASGKLWVEGMMGDSTSLGPVKVTKQISDLCEEGWEISLLLGKYKNKWYIIESGNVYP